MTDRRRTVSLVSAVLLFAAIAPVTAQEAASKPEDKRVKPGALAPPLQVGEWVKGTPIATLEKGKVYLIEFWAVWCGPCIQNIPHLNSLQQRLGKKGLVVIGFTSPDLDDNHEDAKNTIESVRRFVALRGESMNYPIAFDKAGRETIQAYAGEMKPNIPIAFLIDREGRIVISGHPHYLAEVVESVVRGTWDQKKGMERYARVRELLSATYKAKDYAEFKHVRAELAKESPTYSEITIEEELLRGVAEGDIAYATRAAERMIQRGREGRFQDMGGALNQLLTKEPYKSKVTPLLPVVDRLTTAYVEGTYEKHPSAFKFRAAALAAMGDLEGAVFMQRRAIAVAPEHQQAYLKKQVEEYERRLAEKGRDR